MGSDNPGDFFWQTFIPVVNCLSKDFYYHKHICLQKQKKKIINGQKIQDCQERKKPPNNYVILETKYRPHVENALKKKKNKLIQFLFHLPSPLILLQFLPGMYGMTKANKSSSLRMDNSQPVIKGKKAMTMY